MVQTALVFSGGASLTTEQKARLPEADVIIAADSGIDRAHECSLAVTVAVGDFDSATELGLSRVEQTGARIVRYPEEKDETDLELALLEAQRLGVERIVVVALDGGRVDHYLANLALLADPRFRAQAIEAQLGTGSVWAVHGRHEMTGRVGELVSLLPIGGDAVGVRTEGLRYRLRDETLPAGSPRGMSNQFTQTTAVIEVAGGSLLCVRPEVERPHTARTQESA